MIIFFLIMIEVNINKDLSDRIEGTDDNICHERRFLALKLKSVYPKYFGYNPKIGAYPNGCGYEVLGENFAATTLAERDSK